MNKIEGFNKKRYGNWNGGNVNDPLGKKIYSIIKELNSKNNLKKILEIGCNRGEMLFKLKKDFGFECYGIDIADEAVQKAKEKGLNVIVWNVENGLPFEDNSFDLILISEVIEHIFHTDFLIEEMKRCTKVNGFIIITTPNLASLVNRIYLLMGKYPGVVPEFSENGAGHIRAYTLNVLKNQCLLHGLKVLRCSSAIFPGTYIISRYFKSFETIGMKFGDVFKQFGRNIIIVAQK